jgi:hypothetical protein
VDGRLAGNLPHGDPIRSDQSRREVNPATLGIAMEKIPAFPNFSPFESRWHRHFRAM